MNRRTFIATLIGLPAGAKAAVVAVSREPELMWRYEVDLGKLEDSPFIYRANACGVITMLRNGGRFTGSPDMEQSLSQIFKALYGLKKVNGVTQTSRWPGPQPATRTGPQ